MALLQVVVQVHLLVVECKSAQFHKMVVGDILAVVVAVVALLLPWLSERLWQNKLEYCVNLEINFC